MLTKTLVHWIEAQAWLDRTAVPVRDAVRAALDQAPPIDRFLRGVAFGHPLHAALVTLPLGLWSAVLALDIAGATRKRGDHRRSADLLLGLGLAAVAPSAAAGLADFSRTNGLATRIGLVHAGINLAVAALYASSLVARTTGHRKLGVAFSSIGFTVVGFSAWLGGDLSFRYHVGAVPGPRDVDSTPAATSPTAP